jgi:hypothetical protein
MTVQEMLRALYAVARGLEARGSEVSGEDGRGRFYRGDYGVYTGLTFLLEYGDRAGVISRSN